MGCPFYFVDLVVFGFYVFMLLLFIYPDTVKVNLVFVGILGCFFGYGLMTVTLLITTHRPFFRLSCSRNSSHNNSSSFFLFELFSDPFS